MIRTANPCRLTYRCAALGLAAALIPSQAMAQQAAQPEPAVGVADIIVTAQKRQQSVNDVGITISAASGEALRERGISSVTDLPRLVPGFTVQDSAFNSTSFTLRGVGFFNSDLSTPPTVSVYVDEAPLPYPAMTRLAAFDLERVEVLKGPQGTLYGQNATGGAVNYIAAKPTDTLKGGLDLGYGRFNRFQGSGFLSGPLTDTLNARIALQGRTGSAWQKSTTRPGDKLGKVREFQGRVSLDWRPTDRLKSLLTTTYTHDGSEAIAAQLYKPVPVFPALAPPGLLTYPIVLKPRAADWSPTNELTGEKFPYRRDTNLLFATLRNDYTISDDVTLTSLTSYSRFRTKYGQDLDGTSFHLYEAIDTGGKIDSIFQEVRLSGKTDRFNWLIGGNYDHDKISDNQAAFYGDKDACKLFLGVDPQAFCDSGTQTGRYKVDTFGIYGRAEYKILDNLIAEGAIRYNDDRRKFDGCTYANTVNIGKFFDVFQSLVNGGVPVTPVNVGDCFVLDPNNSFRPVDIVETKLHQHNVSFRAGLNWKVVPGTLLYANISKGYKAGTVPVLGAATVTQYAPIGQESVLAYEVGFKASLFDRHVQFNAAGFYYDYKHKQLRGTLLDPAFGPLEALVSIPKSRVEGFEAQVVLQPTANFTLDSSVTYVNSKIDRFTGYDGLANFGDQSGTPFPFSPKWQSVTDASLKQPIGDALNAFVGGTLTYNSKTYSGIGAQDLLKIASFALVDLRGGIETADGHYRFSVWGKNIFNKYHWTSAFLSFGTIVRYLPDPSTYGLTLSYRF